MARPLRIEFPRALRHVIVRGNERKAVFRDDADRVKYLASLAHYREEFGFRLLAYCLMGRLEGLMRGDRPLRQSVENVVRRLRG